MVSGISTPITTCLERLTSDDVISVIHGQSSAGGGGAEMAELDIARPDNAAPDHTEVLEHS